jgi:aminocarboxymuconate-semialdehyde decarboxylase
VKEWGSGKVILGSDYPYDMGTFECARQVKALSVSELDKVKMLNGVVQTLLAGVK